LPLPDIKIKTSESQKRRWELLGKNYREEGVALFLGAGVSIGCNLPNWPDLICRVAEVCWGTRAKQTVSELLAHGLNLPAIAGIIKSELRTEAEFLDIIRPRFTQIFPSMKF
jgi:hypothetical protein